MQWQFSSGDLSIRRRPNRGRLPPRGEMIRIIPQMVVWYPQSQRAVRFLSLFQWMILPFSLSWSFFYQVVFLAFPLSHSLSKGMTKIFVFPSRSILFSTRITPSARRKHWESQGQISQFAQKGHTRAEEKKALTGEHTVAQRLCVGRRRWRRIVFGDELISRQGAIADVLGDSGHRREFLLI